MKSKYILYALFFFLLSSGQMGAMNIAISELDKKEWHEACVSWAINSFIEKDPLALPLEIMCNEDFIAEELMKKLDNQDHDLKKLMRHRNVIFEALKERDTSEHSSLLYESIGMLSFFIKPGPLLPFILSLEEPIKKRIESVFISDLNKKKWHEEYIHEIFRFFLKEKWLGLSFEIIGSKKFIANELKKKLDNHDDDLKELVRYRNNMLAVLKKREEEEHPSLIDKNIEYLSKFVDLKPVLQFILSLEKPIKERIMTSNRAVEIEWRKGAYKHFNFQTGCCIHAKHCCSKINDYCTSIEACLELDIEREFTLKELLSGCY